MEKADSQRGSPPAPPLWNQRSFTRICITLRQPGFGMSGMSESFLGYENPPLQRTKEKEGESKLTEQQKQAT